MKKNRCVPDGLDKLLDKAGDDVATLQMMLLAMEHLIARRDQVEKTLASAIRSSLPTNG